MGGASAEISFIPKKDTKLPSDYSSSFRLYGKSYTVYSHSFLCYGMKEAERRVLASLVQVKIFCHTILVFLSNRPFPGNLSFKNA